jgi:O-6-methylguanine DNA methyltransferase
MAEKDRSNSLLRRVVRHPLTTVTLFAVCKDGAIIIKSDCFGEMSSLDGREALTSSHPELVTYERMVKEFLDGALKSLSRIPIDLSTQSKFSREVLLRARSIPWGTTVTYTQLAALAGNPKACRAAASVMRSNPCPLIVPCHRVIKSDGSIGGFMGKLEGREVELKRKLLEREGWGLDMRQLKSSLKQQQKSKEATLSILETVQSEGNLQRQKHNIYDAKEITNDIHLN